MTIYEEAHMTQGACNAVGLLNSCARFAAAVIEDCDTGKWKGERNHHPLIRLLAEQLMYLSQMTTWGEAWDWCKTKMLEEQEKAA
jgi:hypothetical protein